MDRSFPSYKNKLPKPYKKLPKAQRQAIKKAVIAKYEKKCELRVYDYE